MKLSIIIPIYNVEPYIRKCLDSLFVQGLDSEEYEIICVDDGSTDKSGQIADTYAEKSSNITVIHQENRGVSVARNMGIEMASGEYLYFIDPDDYLKPNILSRLYDIAKQYDLEKLLFDYLSFEDGTEPEKCEEYIELGEPLLFENALIMGESDITPKWKIVWNYLVKNSVIKKFNLRFFEIRFYEDIEFNYWLDRCAESCGYIPQKLYYYRRRKTGILGTFMNEENFPKYIWGRIDLAAHFKQLSEDYSCGKGPELPIPVTSCEMKIKMIDEVQGILNNLVRKGDKELFEDSIDRLKKEGLYPYPIRWDRLFRKSRKNLKNQLVDLASFLHPLEGLLRTYMWIRCKLSGIIKFST